MEYAAWEGRKLERRRVIDEAAQDARNRYLRKHPLAKTAVITSVENQAIKTALSNIKPVQFTSQVSRRGGRMRYSVRVIHYCEAAFAIAGYSRATLDWLSSMNTGWNEGVTAILIQEWERCYKNGDADDYGIDDAQVTSKNMRQVVERWLNTKAREYSRELNARNAENDDGVESEILDAMGDQEHVRKNGKKDKDHVQEEKKARKSQRYTRKRVSTFYHFSWLFVMANKSSFVELRFATLDVIPFKGIFRNNLRSTTS